MIMWVLLIFVILFVLFQKPSGYSQIDGWASIFLPPLTKTGKNVSILSGHNWVNINKNNIVIGLSGHVASVHPDGTLNSDDGDTSLLTYNQIWGRINDNNIVVSMYTGAIGVLSSDGSSVISTSSITGRSFTTGNNNGIHALNNNNIALSWGYISSNPSYVIIINPDGTYKNSVTVPNYQWNSINDNNIAVSTQGYSMVLNLDGSVKYGPINLGNNWSCINNYNIAVSLDGYSVVLTSDGTVMYGPTQIDNNPGNGYVWINNNNIALRSDGYLTKLNNFGQAITDPVPIGYGTNWTTINDNNIAVSLDGYFGFMSLPDTWEGINDDNIIFSRYGSVYKYEDGIWNDKSSGLPILPANEYFKRLTSDDVLITNLGNAYISSSTWVPWTLPMTLPTGEKLVDTIQNRAYLLTNKGNIYSGDGTGIRTGENDNALFFVNNYDPLTFLATNGNLYLQNAQTVYASVKKTTITPNLSGTAGDRYISPILTAYGQTKDLILPSFYDVTGDTWAAINDKNIAISKYGLVYYIDTVAHNAVELLGNYLGSNFTGDTWQAINNNNFIISKKGQAYYGYNIGFQNVSVQATAPSSANTGDVWFNTSDGTAHMYSGGSWGNGVPISAGSAGTKIYDGNDGIPGSINVGDYIIDPEGTLQIVTDNTTPTPRLSTVLNLKGAAGTNGAPGSKILSGSGTNFPVMNSNDLYIDTSTGDLYQKPSNGNPQLLLNLKGADGISQKITALDTPPNTSNKGDINISPSGKIQTSSGGNSWSSPISISTSTKGNSIYTTGQCPSDAQKGDVCLTLDNKLYR